MYAMKHMYIYYTVRYSYVTIARKQKTYFRTNSTMYVHLIFLQMKI